MGAARGRRVTCVADRRRDALRHPLAWLHALPPPQPPQAAIVITGTALPEAKADASTRSSGSAGAQIEQSPSHELDQLLKDVPGLQLFRRSDARSGHPTSQGVTLRALGGNASSRALLVLDGVPQTDPFGGWVNWPAYDPQDLAGISVVRGGGSVGNGPGALAGTIEMTSRADAGAVGRNRRRQPRFARRRARAGMSLGGGVLSISGRGERSDGFVPVTADTRGPADERAPYREWSGRARWVAPLGGATELQASVDGLSRLAHARDRLQRQPDQRRRCFAAAGRARRVAVERARLLAVAQPDEQLRKRERRAAPGEPRLAAGFGAVARARRKRRAAAADARRDGAADRRRHPADDGENRASSIRSRAATRRGGGWRAARAGPPARSPKRPRQLGAATLTGGARLDHWQVSDGHLFERDDRDRRGAARRARSHARRLAADRARRALRRRSAAGSACARRLISAGECRLSTSCSGRFAPAPMQPPPIPHSIPSGSPARRPGIEYSAGGLRLSLTGFANRLKDAIANVTLGQGPGTVPRRRLRARGRRLTASGRMSMRSKVRGIEASARMDRRAVAAPCRARA